MTKAHLFTNSSIQSTENPLIPIPRDRIYSQIRIAYISKMIDGIPTQQHSNSQSQVLREPIGRNDSRAHPPAHSFIKYTENPHISIPTVRYCRTKYTNRKRGENLTKSM